LNRFLKITNKVNLILKSSTPWLYTQKKSLVSINVKTKAARKVTCAAHAAQWAELHFIANSSLFCNRCE